MRAVLLEDRPLFDDAENRVLQGGQGPLLRQHVGRPCRHIHANRRDLAIARTTQSFLRDNSKRLSREPPVRHRHAQPKPMLEHPEPLRFLLFLKGPSPGQNGQQPWISTRPKEDLMELLCDTCIHLNPLRGRSKRHAPTQGSMPSSRHHGGLCGKPTALLGKSNLHDCKSSSHVSAKRAAAAAAGGRHCKRHTPWDQATFAPGSTTQVP